MSKENCADVIIVGGGIIGASTAYYLAKKGKSVILLEREMMGNGGSSRNGGGVRQSARDAREMPLAMYGINHIWPYLSEELGVDTEYNQAGNIKLAKTQAHLDYYTNVIEANRACGLDIDMLDQKQTREICPCVADDVIGSCFCKTDGHANPLTTTLGFYKRGRELGVCHITGETVTKVLLHRGKAVGVKSADGTIYSGDKIIITAGYESKHILNSVGIDIPMRHKLSECMVVEMQPKMPQMMFTLPQEHTWGYGHQTKHGSFVFGGNGFADHFLKQDGSEGNQPMTIPRVARWLAEYVPMLADAKVIRSWSGWTDVTPDSCAVISKVDEIPGLITGCGFSGHGFGTAPAIGLTLSELACEEVCSVSVEGLRYDRLFMSK
ncbi:MAG: FAD-binding oxidoreductase [Lachnospiraceae bacterium]|nr:FAD-binding oxidoreductase [Lachnospiraceae bacterium]